MSSGVAWIRHLRSRRGRRVFEQALRMYRFHRTPFEDIIDNILSVLAKYNAAYTFPTVASTAAQKPKLLKKIIDAGSEVASHGYQHVKYPLVSLEAQREDIQRSVLTFRKLAVPVKGFRAPYNAYDLNTIELIANNGFSWDAGISHTSDYKDYNDLFHPRGRNGQELSYVSVPLNQLSDDSLIDDQNLSNAAISARLKAALDAAKLSKGLVMFDLHPIRIGQTQYIGILDELISYGSQNNFWFPTVSEYVEYRKNKSAWNGHNFCCLLTGDIDNFYFRDYLRRLV